MTRSLVPYNVKRIFALTASLGFILVGLCILLPFTRPIIIDPGSPNMANIFSWSGLFLLASGVRMMLALFPPNLCQEDMEAINVLSLIVIFLSIGMILIGIGNGVMD